MFRFGGRSSRFSKRFGVIVAALALSVALMVACGPSAQETGGGGDAGAATGSSTATSSGGSASSGSGETIVNSAGLATLEGDIDIDGSSTVFPITEAVAEEFGYLTEGNVKVTVGISGTGGGFKKFLQQRNRHHRRLPAHQGQGSDHVRRRRGRVHRNPGRH